MQNIFSRIFIRIFPADLKEELEKEKESQNAIRKRIEEETKTTGGEDVTFVFLYLYCICIVDKDNRWGRYYFCFPVFVFVCVFVLAFLVMLTHICVDVPIINERRVKVRSGLTNIGIVA